MVMVWEVVGSLCLLVLFGVWMRQWTYWWVRGIKTFGLPPPVGFLYYLWCGRSFSNLTDKAIAKHPSSKVIGMWVLMKPTLLVVDPKLAHQILAGDYSTWPDRGFRDDPGLDPLCLHLVNLSGKRWKLARSWLTPGFSFVNLKALHNNLVREAETMTRAMASDIKVNTLKYTRRMTLSVLNDAVLGLPKSSADTQALVEDAFKGSAWTTLRSIARMYCPSILSFMGIKRFQSNHEISFINLVLERYHNQQSESYDILQSLINAYKQYKSSEDPFVEDLNESIITGNAFGALAAGYDTTSVTLAWGLFELAKHPEIQDRLYSEIHRVLAAHGEPNHKAITDMQYLDNVVSEILRLHSAIVLTSRVSASATKLGELKIPAGLRVFIPINSIHRNPSNFPNPGVFDPDRFTREDFQRIAYLPYGKGPRICIGWRFANTLLKISIITLLKDFKIRLSSETKLPMEVQPYTIFLVPKNPILLKLQPRA